MANRALLGIQLALQSAKFKSYGVGVPRCMLRSSGGFHRCGFEPLKLSRVGIPAPFSRPVGAEIIGSALRARSRAREPIGIIDDGLHAIEFPLLLFRLELRL